MNTTFKPLPYYRKVEQRLLYLNHFLLALLFIAVVAMSSCTEPAPIESIPEQVVEPDSTEIKLAIQAEKDSIYSAFFVHQYIEDLINDGQGVIRGEALFSDVMLPDLYASISYQLLWTDTLKRAKAITVLYNSADDGLNPSDYHIGAIEELLSQNSQDYEIKAGIDMLITDGIILYGTHLLNGKTDPRTLEPTLSYEERVLSEEVLSDLREKLILGEVSEIISSLRPPSHYYSSMMDGLRFYQALTDSGGWKNISIPEQKIEPGDTTRSIVIIRERLLSESDLSLEGVANHADSILDIYDSELQDAVMRFQKRHGLNPDGVIGRGTLKAMNITAREKVKLLKANMERARWIHHDLDTDFVLVNIAGFDLKVVKGDTLTWVTRIMAGKVATATPVFRDEIDYIDFNPDWTIPFSISNGEILPKLKKDPSYLTRNDMQLLSMSGSDVTASNVDFNSYGTKMPYMLRQGPGPGNSLGRVKFLFPNKFSVYLHDTPSRSLFAREERAFSHGCIRVEDPLTLAAVLLTEQGFSSAKVDSIVNAKHNHRVTLAKPLPVLISYSTAFAMDDMVYFYKDVYKRDPPLMKALSL